MKAMTAWVKHRDALPDEIPDELGHAMRELDEVLADSALARVPRNDGGLREALKDEAVRLMYAGHGHEGEDRKRFCPFEGSGPCPDCLAVDNMDAALASSAGEPEVKNG
jgi:hypothetical protein